MAVTPVRISSPRIRVAWPTATPPTSVIAFNGPTGKTPTAIPKSRALGRTVCPPARKETTKPISNTRMTADYTCLDGHPTSLRHSGSARAGRAGRHTLARGSRLRRHSGFAYAGQSHLSLLGRLGRTSFARARLGGRHRVDRERVRQGRLETDCGRNLSSARSSDRIPYRPG